MIFEDRHDAGKKLAAILPEQILNNETIIVLGIPRGGVVVAHEVARALKAPLDVVIARKIRAPSQPELGIGAVVSGDHLVVLNEELVRLVGATRTYLDQEIAYQREEIEKRLTLYRSNQRALELEDRTVIVIDDGIATGYTFRAALEGLRRKKPQRLIAAAPVAAQESCLMLQSYADAVVCLHTPANFSAVGAWYRNFDQTTDEEVRAILAQHRHTSMQP